MSNIDDKLNEVLNIAEEVLDKKEDKNPYRSERVTVTPNPTGADKDDSYTYTTALDFFDDAKNYEEETGNDT